MSARAIDLNADVGEGFADADVLPWVSSANVACGAHAGDEETARAAIRIALRCGARVGAHPSFPDRAGFGRRISTHDPSTIEDFVGTQIDWLAALAAREGTRLSHVKPHGALYNLAAVEPAVAAAIARATRRHAPDLPLVLLAGSTALDAARSEGVAALAEAFVDRAYRADGTLAPRDALGAVIDDPSRAAERALAIAAGHPVATLEGGRLVLTADTLCLHGDGARAGEIARSVAAALRAGGYSIRAPVVP